MTKVAPRVTKVPRICQKYQITQKAALSVSMSVQQLLHRQSASLFLLNDPNLCF